MNVDQVEKSLKQEEVLGRSKPCTDHHAIVCPFIQSALQDRLSPIAGVHQTGVDFKPQRSNALYLRINVSQSEFRR